MEKHKAHKDHPYYELKNWEKKILFSPIRLGLLILSLVFVFELSIMFALGNLSGVPVIYEYVIDSFLLSLALTPIIIFFLLRPLKKLVDQYKINTALLNEQKGILEEKVFERTAELTKVVSQLRDEITARDKAEKNLQQTLKIKSIGQLAGGVAHDFNNMLGVILGRAEMALRKIDRGQPVKAEINEILKAANHSADLTKQLLTFARKQPINPRIVDLNKSIRGVLKMLQRLIGEHVQLFWTPAPDIWMVKCDPTQIDQILANLCVNSRDAIGGNGHIIIKTQNQIVDDFFCKSQSFLLDPGEYVQLSVQDNGCGMSEEVQKHIFEPFYTTKEIGAGTGLGLATIYGAVKQNNGFITYKSALGEGTTFQIYLPKANAEAATQVGQNQGETRCGNEMILLVEDDASVLSLIKSMLEEYGYNVIDTSSAESAIALTQKHTGPLHLLISDVIMPGMNGKELSEKIRQIRPDIEVLFMSGYGGDIISTQGNIDDGVNFLQKPVSYEDLTDKVREILDART